MVQTKLLLFCNSGTEPLLQIYTRSKFVNCVLFPFNFDETMFSAKHTLISQRKLESAINNRGDR